MILLKVVGALLLSTLIHEGGHATYAMMQGADVTRFSVIPSDGHFGYVEVEGLPKSSEPGFYLAGFGASTLSIPVSSAFIKKYPDEEFFRIWRAMAVLDFPAHVAMSYFQDDNDVNKFCKRSGISKGWVVASAALYLMFSKDLILQDGKLLYRKYF